MKTIVITSYQGREGKTTLAVNLLAAARNKGLRAMLLDQGQERAASVWMSDAGLAGSLAESEAGDLLFIDLDRHSSGASQVLAGADLAILSVLSQAEREDFAALADWDRELAEVRGQGFDLVVPNLYDQREWERNELFLDHLAEALDWDRIANPVIHCSRIELLPAMGITVWELPVENRKQPFREIMEFIEEKLGLAIA